MLIRLESGRYINPDYVISLKHNTGTERWETLTVAEVGNDPNPYIISHTDAMSILEYHNAKST